MEIAHSDATIKGKVNFLAEKQRKLKTKQKKKNRENGESETRQRNYSFISDLFFSFGPGRAFFTLIFVKKSRQFDRIF